MSQILQSESNSTLNFKEPTGYPTLSNYPATTWDGTWPGYNINPAVYTPPVDWQEINLRSTAIEATIKLFKDQDVSLEDFAYMLDHVYNWMRFGGSFHGVPTPGATTGNITPDENVTLTSEF